MARAVLLFLFLLVSRSAATADPQWIAIFGRGAESADTDIFRLAYRHPLKENGAWWKPSHVQLGASSWHVPDVRGQTQRFDLNLTAIWRSDESWGYWEAGFGGYLLSKTVNNDENRLPSAFEFGSHIGAGLRLAKNHTLGVAIQHLSNAGIKQPNGGIDLVLVQYTLAR
ncbi:MAG TPA: acyloxyacyl hydrolase [Burkholderiales bacterium]|nr:acyloxyacyl hydrolase [Burkholderiales bacterium]